MRLQVCDFINCFEKQQKAALIFLTALIFFHRPVMAAGFFSWAGITLFTEGLYIVFALGLLLLRWETLRQCLLRSSVPVKISFTVLFLSGFLHWIASGFYRLEYLGLALAWSVLPLMGAVYRKELEKQLPVFLCCFWILNVLVCFGNFIFLSKAPGEFFSRTAFGLTGNWNWSAILLLISTPFSVLFFTAKTKYKKTVFVLTVGLSLFLLYMLQSRAAVLSLFAAGLFFFFLKYRKIRIFMTGSVLFLLVAGISGAFCLFPEQTERFLNGEIRLEIWKGVLDMLKDLPAGVGAVTFENSFIPYKTVEYFLNPHCAIRTTHPHNEALYLAAALGLPALGAAITWLTVSLCAAVKEYDSGKMNRTRFLFLLVFIALLVNGMFDITFHAWPTGVIAFLSAGLFAFPERNRSTELPERVNLPAFRIGTAVILFSILAAGINFAGTFFWEASHAAFVKRDDPSALSYAKKAKLLAPEFIDLIYRSATEISSRDRTFALELSERIQKSPWNDFAHIHGLNARIYALSGNDEKAIPEYLMDAQCYPLQILPYIGAGMSYGRLGRTDMVKIMDQKIRELVKFRKLTPSDVHAIMRNPGYDMHPERIPQKKQKH